jgi:pyruvate/2-oxoglutarate dehydrogenase complex dihydrolipoamide acyltransferase (E2) component
VRAVNGKPVEHAAVIFHPIEGDRDKGVMELKTNEDGKTVIDVIPVGDTVRLQIIAKGFQTYGQDYKVDKESMSMQIRLKRPGEQYSIYKTNGDPVDSGAPATPPAATKPSGTPGQADNQSAPAHPQPN